MKRILIVEDEKDMQDIYKDMFRNQLQYQIDIVDGALPAARKLNEGVYDLVILDIIMSPIAGDSFFVYMKSSKQTENIPVLVISVLGDELLEKLKKIDHAHFIQKPITREQLMDRVRTILT
jgi:two-component system phosphate regulon response regulator PhoB